MSNTLGCDLSHFQTVDSFWDLVSAQDNLGFCYLKATQGTTFTDPTYADYRERANTVGLRTGSYLFLNPTLDGAEQGNYFISVVGQLQPGELAPAVDCESTPGWAGDPHVIAACVEVLVGAYGECKIYASPGWWAGQFDGVDWSQHPAIEECQLWVANYGVSSPNVMAPWNTWQIWQDGEAGTIVGVEGSGNLDTDQWNGQIPPPRVDL
jgi:lysozyme